MFVALRVVGQEEGSYKGFVVGNQMLVPCKNAGKVFGHMRTREVGTACPACIKLVLRVGSQVGIQSAFLLPRVGFFHGCAPLLAFFVTQFIALLVGQEVNQSEQEVAHIGIHEGGSEPFARICHQKTFSPGVVFTVAAHGKVVIASVGNGGANAQGKSFFGCQRIGSVQGAVAELVWVAAAVNVITHPRQAMLLKKPAQATHARAVVLARMAGSTQLSAGSQCLRFRKFYEQGLAKDDLLANAHADANALNADVYSKHNGIGREKGVVPPALKGALHKLIQGSEFVHK